MRKVIYEYADPNGSVLTAIYDTETDEVGIYTVSPGRFPTQAIDELQAAIAAAKVTE